MAAPHCCNKLLASASAVCVGCALFALQTVHSRQLKIASRAWCYLDIACLIMSSMCLEMNNAGKEKRRKKESSDTSWLWQRDCEVSQCVCQRRASRLILLVIHVFQLANLELIPKNFVGVLWIMLSPAYESSWLLLTLCASTKLMQCIHAAIHMSEFKEVHPKLPAVQ